MTKKPVSDFDKFIVRLPDGMRDKIAAAAKANNRTMNAEVVARLEASMRTGSAGTVDEQVARIVEATARLDESRKKFDALLTTFNASAEASMKYDADRDRERELGRRK